MELRPYQCEALDAIRLHAGSGCRRQVLQMATGTGKTVVFAELLKWPGIREMLEGRPTHDRRVLIVAHREELLDQAAAKLSAANPDLWVAIEQGPRKAPSAAEVVIASVQTLAASGYRRLDELIAKGQPRIVIVDEAHHASAETYRGVLARLGFPQLVDGQVSADVGERLLLGVTATPNRADGVGLDCVFERIVYAYPLRRAIEDRWLSPILPWAVETRVSLDGVRVTAGDYNTKDLSATVNTPMRNRLAVRQWHKLAGKASTLAFTVDVEHAHALAAEFQADGVAAVAVSGETPGPQRREILRAYAAGEIPVVTNCAVLTEGTDLPITGCVLLARPTRSAALLEQMVGRGLRLFAGKKECVVIDLVDATKKIGLQTVGVLYGLPPQVVASGQQLHQIAQRWELFREAHPGLSVDHAGRKTIDEFEAIARTVNLWAIPSMGRLNVAFRWLNLGDRYRLSYPVDGAEEAVVVEQDLLGQWAAVVRQAAQDGRLSVLGIVEGVKTAQAALGHAEAWIRAKRSSALRIVDGAAPWRRMPATEGQLKRLKWARVPVRDGLTRGEAADLNHLVDARKAERAARAAGQEGR